MRAFAAALLLLLIVGCSDNPKPTEREREADRRAKAEAFVSKAPRQWRYQLPDGELIVVDVNTLADGAYGFTQKCFIWRDKQFNTASLQCPADVSGDDPPSP